VLRAVGWLGWLIVGYLLAAAVYELTLALRHSISPDGEWRILGVAVLAMLAGAVLLFRIFRFRFPGLLAPAAALFVVARLYTGDPYYEPDFHAYGDGGLFSTGWGFALLVLGLAAGIATQRWRRTAPWESAVVLLLLAFTATFMSAGH
jgi:hypothetical protein